MESSHTNSRTARRKVGRRKGRFASERALRWRARESGGSREVDVWNEWQAACPELKKDEVHAHCDAETTCRCHNEVDQPADRDRTGGLVKRLSRQRVSEDSK